MLKIMQEELFKLEDYTYLCRNCRGEFPRSIEFFPFGKCRDKLASICRKCSGISKKKNNDIKETNIRIKNHNLTEKRCEECREFKVVRQFYMSSDTSDGKTRSCKSCIDKFYSERHIRQKYFSGFSWVVYFIQNSGNKRVKIGLSEDIEKTLSSLQEGSSEKLFLLAIHELGEKDKAENAVKVLHSLFQPHHKENNWFEMEPSLEQYISILKSANNEGAKILITT